MKKLFVLAIVASFISGCDSEPRIDGSSEEAYASSIKILLETTEPALRDSLTESLAVIAFRDGNIFSMLSDAVNGEDSSSFSSIYKTLDGLSVGEIFEKAASVRRARVSADSLRVAGELNTLLSEERQALSSKQHSSFFLVSNAEFKIVEKTDWLKSIVTVFDFDVTNNTSSPIAGFELNCIFKSADRATPWIEDEITHKIAGGIEPGETLHCTVEEGYGALGPSRIQEIVPDGALLILEVDHVFDNDFHSLFGDGGFGESKSEIISRLKKQLSEFQINQ